MPCPGRWTRFRRTFSTIHLVDKCLIVFMLVLLVQSAYMLFIPLPNGSDAAHIDVIIRTSAAAIFGYFLSANFITHASLGDAPPNPQSPPLRQSDASSSVGAPKGRVGFAPEEPDTSLEPGGAAPLPPPKESTQAAANRLQILVAAGIGLFALMILLLIRDLSAYFEVSQSDAATATVAQLRDFVSGCVGFLIGCPTAKKNRPQ